MKLNLSSVSNNGNNNNGTKKTPGFDVVLFIAAICGAMILVGRKRFR